ncbi:hypothetical protein [Rubinisphaera margarita]|uniref:hypothetical protein n=1 Tax=Rubinisphaera margarita TaxID=2909586 RepID=UPI001EE98ED9|nr:hypothetical protein [Rubinisphaera margarita]MCG6156977.1 hypothetical protein [Rubinisphaera margarita]
MHWRRASGTRRDLVLEEGEMLAAVDLDVRPVITVAIAPHIARKIMSCRECRTLWSSRGSARASKKNKNDNGSENIAIALAEMAKVPAHDKIVLASKTESITMQLRGRFHAIALPNW